MTTNPAAALADPKNTVESIQSELLKRICFLEYKPGHQLKEAELAKEFNVSRTPVRDAISRISHLGLVETRNGVGTIVVALSPAKIIHVYEMRLELAQMIGTLSPQEISEEDKVFCKELLDQATKLKDNFLTESYIELNHRLHTLIAGLIGNTVLRSFWWQTYYQAASTWHQLSALLEREMIEALINELRDISQALDNNDVQAVGHIQRIHIGYGFSRIKSHLLKPDEV